MLYLKHRQKKFTLNILVNCIATVQPVISVVGVRGVLRGKCDYLKSGKR
jgi:hypothetical protein